MYTIRDLCKSSKLSRSTILYYDSLGLLTPDERSESNYRLYSEESLKTLERICLYRDAGVHLEDIKVLLNTQVNNDRSISILEKTLMQLNELMRDVQNKQKTLVDLIKKTSSASIGKMNTDESDELHLVNLEKKILAFSFNMFRYSNGENPE